MLTLFCSILPLNRKTEPKKSSLQAALKDGVASVASAFGGGSKLEEEKKDNDKPRFSLAAVDSLLPKIRRGFASAEEKEEDNMVVGWKSEVRSRKDREKMLRYVLTAFEVHLNKTTNTNIIVYFQR